MIETAEPDAWRLSMERNRSSAEAFDRPARSETRAFAVGAGNRSKSETRAARLDRVERMLGALREPSRR